MQEKRVTDQMLIWMGSELVLSVHLHVPPVVFWFPLRLCSSATFSFLGRYCKLWEEPKDLSVTVGCNVVQQNLLLEVLTKD